MPGIVGDGRPNPQQQYRLGAVVTPTDFRAAVVGVVAALDPGDVLTYGQVARIAGHPGAARRVGTVLRQESGLPWWRVVHANGTLVVGLEDLQATRLAQEGVQCQGHRVLRGEAPGAGS